MNPARLAIASLIRRTSNLIEHCVREEGRDRPSERLRIVRPIPKPRQMRDLALADLDLGEAKPVLTPSTGVACIRSLAVVAMLRCHRCDVTSVITRYAEMVSRRCKAFRQPFRLAIDLLGGCSL